MHPVVRGFGEIEVWSLSYGSSKVLGDKQHSLGDVGGPRVSNSQSFKLRWCDWRQLHEWHLLGTRQQILLIFVEDAVDYICPQRKFSDVEKFQIEQKSCTICWKMWCDKNLVHIFLWWQILGCEFLCVLLEWSLSDLWVIKSAYVPYGGTVIT